MESCGVGAAIKLLCILALGITVNSEGFCQSPVIADNAMKLDLYLRNGASGSATAYSDVHSCRCTVKTTRQLTGSTSDRHMIKITLADFEAKADKSECMPHVIMNYKTSPTASQEYSLCSGEEGDSPDDKTTTFSLTSDQSAEFTIHNKNKKEIRGLLTIEPSSIGDSMNGTSVECKTVTLEDNSYCPCTDTLANFTMIGAGVDEEFEKQSDLSKRLTAGFVSVVVLVCIAIVIFLIYWFVIRKRNQEEKAPEDISAENKGYNTSKSSIPAEPEKQPRINYNPDPNRNRYQNQPPMDNKGSHDSGLGPRTSSMDNVHPGIPGQNGLQPGQKKLSSEDIEGMYAQPSRRRDSPPETRRPRSTRSQEQLNLQNSSFQDDEPFAVSMNSSHNNSKDCVQTEV